MEQKAEWVVYLIKTRIESYYCGVTTNITRRMNEHQSNGKLCAKYLRGKQPLSLAWSIVCEDKQQAMQLEYRIKQLKKTQKELIVNKNYDLKRLLTICS